MHISILLHFILFLLLIHTYYIKRIIIDFEYPAFKALRNVDYFNIELDGKMWCLLCSHCSEATRIQYVLTLSYLVKYNHYSQLTEINSGKN